MVIKKILFIVIPFILLILFTIYIVKSKEITNFQRWIICGMIGGGLGNLIDRAFKVDWVVDFVSVKFYGLFGFERWPTFNLADASIVVCAILLIFTLLFTRTKNLEEKSE